MTKMTRAVITIETGQLVRNRRWGSVAVAAALVAASDELDEHFNGEG